MQTKVVERYFFFGLLAATLVFTFFIFRPFWIVLVLGACFAIVLKPVYKWLSRMKLPPWLASLLTVLLFAILICGPLFGIGVIVFNQSMDLYQNIVRGGNLPSFEAVNQSIDRYLPAGINFDLGAKANDFILAVTSNVGRIFSSTLSTIFSFILMLLAIFYFLKDGSEWRKSLIILSPLSEDDDKKIMDRLALSVNGVIKGYILIAIIQGTLMGLGLAIFGVPSAALWGVVAAIGSLIPTIGTALVSVPAVIFLLATGHSGAGIGLAVWSVAIVGTIDNLLNPYIVGNKINIPPFLILFSVLGGVALLGPIGILIGPITVSLLYTLVSIYRTEYQEKQNVA